MAQAGSDDATPPAGPSAAPPPEPAPAAERATTSSGFSRSTGRARLRRFREAVIRTALLACALLSILVTVAIIFVLVNEGAYSLVGPKGQAFFQQVPFSEFLSGTKWLPSAPPAQRSFGVLPLLYGTLLVTGIAALVGLPIGLLSAVYLSEYASPRTRNVLKPMLEILAGIPTIVYGYFAVRILTPYLIKPAAGLFGLEVNIFNALSAGLVVGVMIIPLVCSLSEDALRAVPRSLREASYALGATKFQVCLKTVIPAAISGIAASFLLAVARAIGETMAVVMAAGNRPQITFNPLDSIQTMTAFIASTAATDSEIGSIPYKSLYAVALALFLVTLTMNVISHFVTTRYREAYQ